MLNLSSALRGYHSETDTSKFRLPGTDRALNPEDTLDLAYQAATKVGITRVANITQLDNIGIPTFQAIRPTALTVAVSQGKGVTDDLAKISAMMEAIEHWHIEQPIPISEIAPVKDVISQLCYDVYQLPQAKPSILYDALPLEWVSATSLLDGSETLIPKNLVGFSLAKRDGWNAPIFFESTNGVASGNTHIEAILHGLYEVIERDAVTRVFMKERKSARVNPRTVGSSLIDELCSKIERAKVKLELSSIPSPTELPCFLARITSDSYRRVFQGYGCHTCSEIAIIRAITEATQARLAYVSGARDDLRSDFEDKAENDVVSTYLGSPITKFSAHSSLIEDLADVVERTSAVFAAVPLVSNLTNRNIGIPVIRVVVPGTRINPMVF